MYDKRVLIFIINPAIILAHISSGRFAGCAEFYLEKKNKVR